MRALVWGGLLMVSGVLTACVGNDDTRNIRPPQRHLLVVLDGLRPDYVTPEQMPNLSALGDRGVVFTNHHSVYPTVTRVNAASISTGAYPDTHGLLGNSVFFPSVDATRFLNTSDWENLLAIEASDRDLLTAPTLGEQLQAAGASMLVASSGSSGSAYLLNHTVAGGGTIHYDFVLPPSLSEVVLQVVGDAPPAGTPNDARHRYIVDAFFDVGLPQVDPAVAVVWLSDPDTTAHANGIGNPSSREALERVDTEIGRIQQRLTALGLDEAFNVWVTSDHGFSTHTGATDLTAVLAPFGDVLEDGSPRVVASPDAIYVRDGDPDTIAAIASALQNLDGVGAVFTAPATAGSRDGWVPGTLSFDLARWQHERSADILFSADWTSAENEHGYRGATAQGGVAGHGSTSPFDIHNTLIAAGPALKSGVTIDVPSGNVDFAPTFLSVLGIDIPASMQGRVLHEGLIGGPDGSGVAVETMTHTAVSEDARYRVTVTLSTVDNHTYLDYTEVIRAR